MNPITEKMTQLNAMKTEITKMYETLEPKRLELIKEYDTKKEALTTEYNEKINTLMKNAQETATKYKADLKTFAGITDGEQTDVLSMLTAVKKLFTND